MYTLTEVLMLVTAALLAGAAGASVLLYCLVAPDLKGEK
jgi:hypothetical protein